LIKEIHIMSIVTRHSLMTVVVLVVASLIVIGLFVWSGIYNIGADDTHTRPVHSLLQTLRERSIATRAKELQPPDLADPDRIKQGAGNYDAMCTGCHLGPGMKETELSKGLYPAPPDLTRHTVDPREAFWVIKHGIKASGMPAWGKSMEDEYIWNMAAFLQALPKLDAGQYKVLVASSGGHSHGGDESGGHSHAAGANEGAGEHDEAGEGDDHAAMGHDASSEAAGHHQEPANQGTTHVHADGKRHVHAGKSETATQPATPAKPAEEHADDDHQH
jgi:mono/diheme cytochrome c family protein